MSGKTAPESKEERPEAPRTSLPTTSGAPSPTDFAFTLGKSRLETMRWLLENPRALAEHAGKWVVAADRQIRFSGDSPDELIAQAEAAGFARSDIVMDFLDTYEVALNRGGESYLVAPTP